MFKLALVAITAAYFVVPAHANSLPPVNTNIVNANKAAFVGSMITSQTSNTSTKTIRQAVTPVNREFKNCEACNAWVANLDLPNPGLVAKFVGNANGSGNLLDADWTQYGYIGYIGGCSDITTGLSCPVVPQ